MAGGRRVGTGMLTLAAVLFSGGAAAQQTADIRCTIDASTPCMVTLRSGAIWVGQVTEVLPGQELRLRLLTREERIVPWPEIAAALPAAAPSPPGVPEPVATSEIPVPATAEGMGLVMHVEERPRGLPDEAPWNEVCRAPCASFNMYRNHDYRLRDDDRPGQPGFEVPDEALAVKLRIRPGNVQKWQAGLSLIIVGALTNTAAILGLSLGVTNKSAPPDQQLAGDILLGAGFGVGVPSVIGGVVLMIRGATHVEVASVLSKRPAAPL